MLTAGDSDNSHIISTLTVSSHSVPFETLHSAHTASSHRAYVH